MWRRGGESLLPNVQVTKDRPKDAFPPMRAMVVMQKHPNQLHWPQTRRTINQDKLRRVCLGNAVVIKLMKSLLRKWLGDTCSWQLIASLSCGRVLFWRTVLAWHVCPDICMVSAVRFPTVCSFDARKGLQLQPWAELPTSPCGVCSLHWNHIESFPLVSSRLFVVLE